jgi:integrase
MFNLAIKWGEAKKNPVSDVDLLKEPPGRTRFLSEEEAQRLLACLDAHLKPIVMSALNTGMRLGEIFSLTWDQVHIRAVIEPYLEVKVSKNNKKRFIPLNNDMVNLFDSIERSKASHVFLGTRNEPLKSIRKPFDKALKRAGILDFMICDILLHLITS